MKIIPLSVFSVLSPPSTEIFFAWDMPAKSKGEIQVLEGGSWVTIQEIENKRGTALRTGITLDQSLGQVPRMVLT